ncbi:allene oxide synthase-lipoxygenase protein-like [Dreissena polymorpha]|uniref:allene oxide synthase-lipoxygenase protein-like n=1 Tax=Dreissena polymorpha TaxID=45954 RepID=UPI002263EF09|nr:allene oxide synthase-lipoxygenase protein-like [Dreissena polymorpha]
MSLRQGVKRRMEASSEQDGSPSLKSGFTFHIDNPNVQKEPLSYRTKWKLNVEGTLPANLKERGVDSPEVVSYYPFWDDTLLTYNAILQYVTDYVLLYYPSDTVLSQDIELQSWLAELDRPIANGGLGVLGVEGVNGTFTSRDKLIQVVTSIIYTCSAGHAGVNFKQYDEYAFMINYPSKLRGNPPSDKRSHSERDVLQAIQDRSYQYKLLTIAKIISEHSFGKPLGNFEKDYVCEQKALEIVNKFREELKKINATTQERNRKRPIRYECMLPSLIPNSISI